MKYDELFTVDENRTAQNNGRMSVEAAYGFAIFDGTKLKYSEEQIRRS